jgi:hypothetical protein
VMMELNLMRGVQVAVHNLGTRKLKADKGLKKSGNVVKFKRLVTQAHIRRAARLRVRGLKWLDIAKRLGYSSGNTARHQLMSSHPVLWKAAFTAAYDEYIPVIEGEALEFHRRQMRKGRHPQALLDDRKLGEAAAHSTLVFVSKVKGQKLRLDAVFGRVDVGDVQLIHDIPRPTGRPATGTGRQTSGNPQAARKALMPKEPKT